jgi:hemolysin D
VKAAPTSTLRSEVLDFAPALLRVEAAPPSPLPRIVGGLAAGFLFVVLTWACIARLDVVAVAPGRVVSSAFVQILQPAEGGVVRELLVREGDRVRAGQVVARLDTRISDADSAAVERRLAERRLDVRRLDAELRGDQRLSVDGEPSALAALALARFASRHAALAEEIRGERAAVARAEGDLAAARAQLARVAGTTPLLREQADAWAQLVQEGFAGRLQAQERRRLLLESEGEAVALRGAVASAEAALSQARARLAQREADHRQQLLRERSEAHTEAEHLAAEHRKLGVRRASLDLPAPRDGIVKDLATHTLGAVVQPGTMLMSVVPTDAPLEAEVRVGDVDAGRVRVGQPVRLKVAAYGFQRHGTLGGTIRHVGPDATAGTEASADALRGGTAAGYRAFVALDSDAIEHDGERFPVIAGMLVSAEVHLGTRTVLETLLAPVARTWREAGREP